MIPNGSAFKLQHGMKRFVNALCLLSLAMHLFGAPHVFFAARCACMWEHRFREAMFEDGLLAKTWLGECNGTRKPNSQGVLERPRGRLQSLLISPLHNMFFSACLLPGCSLENLQGMAFRLILQM